MRYQKHEAISSCYYIINQHGSYKPPVVYRGENASKISIEMLIQEAMEIQTTYTNPKRPEILSKEKKKEHLDATICYLCSEKFTDRNWKVFKHCTLQVHIKEWHATTVT